MRIAIIAALALLPAVAGAQTGTPSLPGGLGSLLGGSLPNVGSTSAGNAAGVLSYCVKNKISNATNASSVLGRLTGQKEVTDSPAYTAGQSGVLQTGSGALSLNNVKGQLKTKICDLVLKRATSLL